MGRRAAGPRIPDRAPAQRLPRGGGGLGRVRGLRITPPRQGRQIAPSPLLLDPLAGLHLARSLSDLGRALETELAPLGAEGDDRGVLAIDVEGRVYGLDHAGDWYLGPDFDHALTALVTGAQPTRLANP